MKYLLHTQAWIDFLLGTKGIEKFARSIVLNDLGVSAVSVAHLNATVSIMGSTDSTGALLQRKAREFLRLAMTDQRVLSFDEGAADSYGIIRPACQKDGEGLPIGVESVLIAAHALSADLTLVAPEKMEWLRNVERLGLTIERYPSDV